MFQPRSMLSFVSVIEKNRDKSSRVALGTEWAGVADIRLEKVVLVFTRKEIRSQEDQSGRDIRLRGGSRQNMKAD